MVAGIPIFMTLLFGYAIDHDVRNLRAMVVDEANTSASRALVADAAASQVIRIVGRAGSPRALEEMIAAAEMFRGASMCPRTSRSAWRTAPRPISRFSRTTATPWCSMPCAA